MRFAIHVLVNIALAAASTASAQAQPVTKAETMLAAALKGRQPGQPVNCITLRLIRSVQVIDGIGIIYETRDGTRYLNKPEAGAEGLDSWDVVVANTHTPDLCRIDAVKLYEDGTDRLTGVAKLGAFVPYRKP